MESSGLRGFLGADVTQAHVHFKGLWFQRTSAGYVCGLCQSHVGSDTLAYQEWRGQSLMTIPQSDHSTAHLALTDQKQTL